MERNGCICWSGLLRSRGRISDERKAKAIHHIGDGQQACTRPGAVCDHAYLLPARWVGPRMVAEIKESLRHQSNHLIFCSSGAKRSVHQPHSMLLALLQESAPGTGRAGADCTLLSKDSYFH